MAEKNTKTGDGAQAAVLPGRMPLGARRMLLIGALCVPVGVVGGPYLLGAQLLAVAGVVMVAIALSHRTDGPWFWRLSGMVTAAGVLWLAATASYWGSIIVAAESSAPAPAFAPLLFNMGIGFFAIMALGVAAAVTLRLARGRRAGTAAA